MSKRERSAGAAAETEKRAKQTSGQWRKHLPHAGASSIEPGDSGVFATCSKGKEAKAVGDLRQLLMEHAEQQYRPQLDAARPEAAEKGLEDSIEEELCQMRGSQQSSAGLLQNVKLDVQCVIFFKTAAPIEPAAFVREICRSIASGSGRSRGHFLQRLTPITAVGRATAAGLDALAQAVLAPHFHQQPDAGSKKFAIRPSIRHHDVLTRDGIIRQTAAVVGPGHSVDLTQPDLVILVEVYRNICGMSVVAADYDALRRYNVAALARAGPVSSGQQASAKPSPANPGQSL